MNFEEYTINDVDVSIIEADYIGPYGWYWLRSPMAIASILFKAFYEMDVDVDDVVVHVSELRRHDAGDLSIGCHDRIYSVFAMVSAPWPLPSAEQVHDAYKRSDTDTAPFDVKMIHGGYHFYKTW